VTVTIDEQEYLSNYNKLREHTINCDWCKQTITTIYKTKFGYKTYTLCKFCKGAAEYEAKKKGIRCGVIAKIEADEARMAAIRYYKLHPDEFDIAYKMLLTDD